MTGLRIWTTRQEVRVAAPPKRVFELVADLDRWPDIFDSVAAVERLGFNGISERVRIVERGGHSATSVRETNTKRLQVRFRRVDLTTPFASLGGLWVVTPKGSGAVATLVHYYGVTEDSPTTVNRVSREIAAVSSSMLDALGRAAEFRGAVALAS